MKKVKLSKATLSITLIVAFIIGASNIVTANTDNSIKIKIDGEEIQSNINPIIINDQVMVPVRWLSQAFMADVDWDNENQTVNIVRNKFLTSTQEENIKLFPFQINEDLYDGFILDNGNMRKYFPWINLTNPGFEPEINMYDLNNDNQKEITAVLTIAEGTGVIIQEAFIIDPITLDEINIEKPDSFIHNHFKTQINKENNETVIKLFVDDQEVYVSNISANEEALFDQVIYSNIKRYQIANNKIRLTLGIQLSPNVFIGDMVINYDYMNNQFTPSDITFIPY